MNEIIPKEIIAFPLNKLKAVTSIKVFRSIYTVSVISVRMSTMKMKLITL